MPQMRRCTACGGADLSWFATAGLGTVTTWSLVWRPQDPAYSVPYAPIVVRLDEGVDVLSNLVFCGSDELRVGLRVSVTFAPTASGFVLPYFEPVSRS